MLHRILLTAASVVALTATANAADMYRAPAAEPGMPYVGMNWSGFYAGVQGGGAWGTQDMTNTTGQSVKPSVNGGVVGGQVGWQHEFYNKFVLGAELSGVWADASGSATCQNTNYNCGAKVNDIFEAVGRAGYSFGKVLPYVKGGYANVNMDSTATPTYAGFNGTKNLNGWVAGGGVEYAFTPSLIGGVDYSHIQTDTVGYAVGNGTDRNVSADIDEVTARLSYKTSAGYEPLK